MQCAKCNSDISEQAGLHCNSCSNDYHFKCVGMSDDQFRRIRANIKASWVGPCCLVNTPQTPGVIIPGADCTKDLAAEMHDLRITLNSLSKCMMSLESTLKMTQTTMESFKEDMSAVKSRLLTLEQQNADKERKVSQLKHTVTSLRMDLNEQSQSLLNNDVEIAGLPEVPDENLHRTVLVTAQKIGIEMSDSDVDWVARVGPRRLIADGGDRPPRSVVLRFSRRDKRNQFMKAVKSRRGLKTSDIELASDKECNIYFNDRLTRDNRTLFWETRARARLHDFQYTWVQHGAIHVRKRQGAHAARIRSLADLDTVIGARNVDMQH